MRKTTVHKLNLVEAGDPSSGFNSASTDCLGIDKIAYHLVSSGATNSVCTIQVSGDNTNWADSSATVTLAGAGNKVVELETAHRYVRLSVASGTGAGPVDVHVTGKSI